MPPSSQVVHAFEIDGCLDFLTVPRDQTVTTAARERLLREKGALVGHHRTVFYWLGFVAFLGLCFALHPWMCGIMLFLRWYHPEKECVDHEMEYLLKVYMCLLYAERQEQHVVIVTRNTTANVRRFLERVGWQRSVPILSNPDKEKPEMLREWCVAQGLRSWTLHVYDALETSRLKQWADAHPDVNIHVVPVKHTPMTFPECKENGHVLPGLFHQTLPLQHLWNTLHGGKRSPLPPLFAKQP